MVSAVEIVDKVLRSRPRKGEDRSCPRGTRARGTAGSTTLAVGLTPEQPTRSDMSSREQGVIRSYLVSAAAHGLTALGAVTAALNGKPWLPPPAVELQLETASREHS